MLLRNHCKKNNIGSTFLLVIISMMFVAIIGVVALSMSSDYLVTIIVDKNSTNNYYDAEKILAELRTGLQEYAMEVNKSAYSEIVEKYEEVSSDTRMDKYSKNYLIELANKLIDPATVTWDGIDEEEVVCNIDNIKKFTTVPDAVTAVPGKVLSVVLKNDKGVGGTGYTLTIKNLLIDCKNAGGYQSSIGTDIVMKVPDYHFDGDSTINELKKYVVITDDALDINTTLSNTIIHNPSTMGALLTGNIYTGKIGDGIFVNQQSKANLHSDVIISRGDINMLTGSDLTIRANDGAAISELWLQNIRLSPNASTNSSLYSVADFNTNSYIANDLAINDDRSTMKLSGNYFGYSYNKENTMSTAVQEANYSSAVLINGLNTTLITSGLNKLILAGRAFIGSTDVLTGESLTVKSNQIAYLLPNQYISVGHNPILSTEETSNSVNRTALMASNIAPYLNPTTPYVENNIASTGGGYTFIYYFLNFKDENSANEYFKMFYSNTNNKQAMAERAKTYISTTDADGMRLDASLYLLAGNIIHNYYSGNGSIRSANYFDNTGEPKNEFLMDGIQKGKEYVGRQLALVPSVGGTMRLPVDAPDLVASKIIDFSKITTSFTENFPSLSANVIVASGDCNIASPAKGIVIAKGNVVVQADFEGVIIAGGTVSFSMPGVKATYNQILVKSLLKEIVDNDKLSVLFREIKDFEGTSDLEHKMSDCIKYENWEIN